MMEIAKEKDDGMSQRNSSSQIIDLYPALDTRTESVRIKAATEPAKRKKKRSKRVTPSSINWVVQGESQEQPDNNQTQQQQHWI